jgi:hypothetical protein
MPGLFIACLLILALPFSALGERRQVASLIKDYQGTHPAEFNAQFDRVRLLVRQAQLEVSSRLGLLQYREGFQYPIAIRFEDDAPAGLENSLAYVRYSRSAAGFEQELVVNLTEMIAHPIDFDTVFYHEMTHAVLNDAVGGEATLKIPRWLQEGLAVYVSGEGDNRVELAAVSLRRSQADRLVFPLEGNAYGNAYPQYYLAIKYLLEKHSVNAVQGLVRNLIQGQSTAEAIQDTTGLTWDEYKRNVAQYSLRTFRDLALPDTVTRR